MLCSGGEARGTAGQRRRAAAQVGCVFACPCPSQPVDPSDIVSGTLDIALTFWVVSTRWDRRRSPPTPAWPQSSSVRRNLPAQIRGRRLGRNRDSPALDWKCWGQAFVHTSVNDVVMDYLTGLYTT